jgi:YegS/Rv2252/BmrU family lipid kinase
MSEFLSKKWLVLINPVSGGGKVKKKWSKIIKKEFDTMKLNYTEYFTIAPEDAIHKIEEEIANYDGFIAVGGDGTCNEVLNGILYATVEKGNQNDKLLAMIPAGTGNDLCHAIGIPYKDALEACDLFKTGQIKKIDTGKATGKTFAGDDVSRYFCGVLSTGFDAEVAHKTNTASKWLPGTTNYIKSLLTTLLSMKTRGYTYKANGKEVTENGILLAVGLGPYYGGGMMICPNAKVDDGIFDIVFLRKVTRRTLLRVFPKVYDGKHITHKAVVEIEAPSIDISNTIDTIWQVDGEIIGNTPVKVTTVKEGLNVLVP